jgi:hypothetical protein
MKSPSQVVKKKSKSSPKDVRKSKPSATKKVKSPYFKRIKRSVKQGAKAVLLSPVFHSAFRVIATVFVSSLLIYSSYFFIGKTFANEVVISQSEIIARVGVLTSLPQEAPYEIVRVQDEEALRKQNLFYKDINEGDYILIYKNLAVIYDLRNNTIKGIKRPGDR